MLDARVAPASLPWTVTLNSTLELQVPRFTQREAKEKMGSTAFPGWVLPTGVGLSQVIELVSKRQLMREPGGELWVRRGPQQHSRHQETNTGSTQGGEASMSHT